MPLRMVAHLEPGLTQGEGTFQAPWAIWTGRAILKEGQATWGATLAAEGLGEAEIG